MQAAADVLSSFEDCAWVCEQANVANPAALDHAVMAELGYVVRPGAGLGIEARPQWPSDGQRCHLPHSEVDAATGH